MKRNTARVALAEAFRDMDEGLTVDQLRLRVSAEFTDQEFMSVLADFRTRLWVFELGGKWYPTDDGDRHLLQICGP